MLIGFVTTNKYKFAEVQHTLEPYPIELEHVVVEYAENHDDGLEEIARSAVQTLAAELNRPIVLEDTGLFFRAYQGFPGALPKFVHNTLGYEGIFKLLEGKDRSAYFKTVAAFGEPGKEPVLFEGIMHGEIATEVHTPEADRMPYEKIFLPLGGDETLSEMTMADKTTVSQRGQAFQKFGDFIVGRIAD